MYSCSRLRSILISCEVDHVLMLQFVPIMFTQASRYYDSFPCSSSYVCIELTSNNKLMLRNQSLLASSNTTTNLIGNQRDTWKQELKVPYEHENDKFPQFRRVQEKKEIRKQVLPFSQIHGQLAMLDAPVFSSVDRMDKKQINDDDAISRQCSGVTTREKCRETIRTKSKTLHT
ncbi:uncharacterized protein BP01DRAFT_240202 [Aspergillus saccharolyticus JOP 1030-1]|uniref:Uncharacterized protein n=1 Tax=Aspergillus saccharolyticus JOP 1030-1 TaxID=1450539 RepID=A0A318ZRB8_9EURO|nr:hypothetical protein BP01DRAFT_240202 [Aspergillus saccharolyticus JOP 1030-1]PYH46903.1 hypothetical protein BP01DRAFT_240202 [Aspergillus saccharolyticus JOP 1030-1]